MPGNEVQRAPSGAISPMKKVVNYLGQLRIYALIDYIFLLIAAQANIKQAIGALLLHIGFLCYLEIKHNHEYRSKLPQGIWLLFILSGAMLYKKPELLVFIAASYLYTLKKKNYWGISSPLWRGVQILALVGGITGYTTILPWLAGVLTLVRNTLGDYRDIEKDKKEKMKTIPIILKVKPLRFYKHIHRIGITVTTIIWWSFTSLPIEILMVGIILEQTTYNLTTR